MKIFYKYVNFGPGTKVRGPIGSSQLGGPQITANAHLRLYRDLDADPLTLVAEGGDRVCHYPWGGAGVTAEVDILLTGQAASKPAPKKSA